MRFDSAGNFGREDIAVDSEGMAAGDARGVGCTQKKRIEAAHLLLQEPGSGVLLLAFEGIAANKFAERVGFMGGAAGAGAHFVEFDRRAGLGCLKGGFAASETRSDDVNL